MLYLTLFEVKRMSYNQSFAAALCLPAQFFVFSLKRGVEKGIHAILTH